MIYRMASYQGAFTDEACVRTYRSLETWWVAQTPEQRQTLHRIARHLPLDRVTFWPVRIYRSHPAIVKGWRMNGNKPMSIKRQITTGGFFYWEPMRDPLVITAGELIDIVNHRQQLGT